jgi:hypothetical protein
MRSFRICNLYFDKYKYPLYLWMYILMYVQNTYPLYLWMYILMYVHNTYP